MATISSSHICILGGFNSQLGCELSDGLIFDTNTRKVAKKMDMDRAFVGFGNQTSRTRKGKFSALVTDEEDEVVRIDVDPEAEVL